MAPTAREVTAAAIFGGLALLVCACSGEAKENYPIPAGQRAIYDVDCRDFCEAESICLAWPDDRHCLDLCREQVGRGAFQPDYVETRHDCVLALSASCGQEDLDGCWSLALSACVPAASQDTSLRTWCSRWLSCNGVSPTDSMVERCMGDLEATPDYALMRCFTEAAWTQLDLCIAAAACAELLDFPPLTICAAVYR